MTQYEKPMRIPRLSDGVMVDVTFEDMGNTVRCYRSDGTRFDGWTGIFRFEDDQIISCVDDAVLADLPCDEWARTRFANDCKMLAEHGFNPDYDTWDWGDGR